jgi:ATP-dependent DNA helicase RecG
MSRQQIQSALGLKGEEHFRKAYLKPALAARAIEMKLPDTPTSRLQRYRLTAIGRQWLKAHPGGNPI